MKRKVIAGNWKMYKTGKEAAEFVRECAPLAAAAQGEVCLAVPFTALYQASEAAKGTAIMIGAQNMSSEAEGAFTGEISAEMLLDAGAKFVIIGHSERRNLYGETNEVANKKVKRALTAGIKPLLCVGETLDQREQGITEKVLKEQILHSLSGITSDQLANLWMAYEPVWAIGTGKTATPEQAEQAHCFCREVLKEYFGSIAAEEVSILYGGSANPANAQQLLKQSHVDGLLVGGASLKIESFGRMIAET